MRASGLAMEHWWSSSGSSLDLMGGIEPESILLAHALLYTSRCLPGSLDTRRVPRATSQLVPPQRDRAAAEPSKGPSIEALLVNGNKREAFTLRPFLQIPKRDR